MSRQIVLVVHALHGGGAERVAVTMASQWAAEGDRVTTITLDSVDSDVYPIDSRVDRVGLDLMKDSRTRLEAIWNNRRRVRALRRAIRDASPDCVVSVTDQMNVLTLLACRSLSVPVIIAEHSDPRHQRLGTIREWLRRRTYPTAAAAVVLTHAVAEHLRPVVRDCPIYVVPNGIARPEHVTDSASPDKRLLVVAMGRLSQEKGFDTLIDAFANLPSRHSDWRLEIAGEGSQRASLQQQIEQHRLGSRAQLVGWVSDPVAFLARAEIFVLSSRYEGFPVSLLEAMSLGMAVVSFDCDSGPREIIRHKEDGLLVEQNDSSKLTQAILQLIEDEPMRQRIGASAGTVVERFGQEQFFARWRDVLRDVLQPTGSNDTSRQS